MVTTKNLELDFWQGLERETGMGPSGSWGGVHGRFQLNSRLPLNSSTERDTKKSSWQF